MRAPPLSTDSHPPALRAVLTRRSAVAGLFGFALAGCGGGTGEPFEGSIDSGTVGSRSTGTDYPLRLYLPPASAGPRGELPVVYLLDGETWFDTLVDFAEASRTRVIIVGIGTAGQRNRDFVPANTCSAGGGGQAAYFDFLRLELIPYVEGTFGGHPGRRALFGHSHGGSFVLFAMFSEPADRHSFAACLSCDASIGCMVPSAYGWEASYAALYPTLPVRLHLSYASAGNAAANMAYADPIAQRDYRDLTFVAQVYPGTHGGIVPQALADAVAFAFAGG
ncbi:MAG: alpha/beta hydrolase-fold protein [Rubrivivax sp.]